MFECTSIMFRACKQRFSGLYAKSLRKELLLENAPSAILSSQPSRNTIILKRKFPVSPYKSYRKPKLTKQHQFYDFVEDTNTSKPEPLMDVVLKTHVSGLGNDGDIVTLKKYDAYNRILVTGLGDFATPENLEYSRKKRENIVEQQKLVTPSEEYIINFLKKRLLLVLMSKENEWTLEPWHIQANLRLSGVQVLSLDQIQLPAQPISGPDMQLQDKAFYISIMINKKHKVNVRCKIHHWATSPLERLPLDIDYWREPGELLFPEDKQYEEVENLAPAQ